MTEEKSLDGIEVGYPGSISGADIPKCLSTIAPRFTLNNVRMKLLNAVRRQGFWHQELRKLRECPAHLVGFIMRRAVCDASVALRVSFV